MIQMIFFDKEKNKSKKGRIDLGVLGSLLEAEDDPMMFLYEPQQNTRIVRCVELPILSYTTIATNDLTKENKIVETNNFSVVNY